MNANRRRQFRGLLWPYDLYIALLVASGLLLAIAIQHLSDIVRG